MDAPVPQITVDEKHRAVLRALRGLGGRATVGDVVATAGVPRDQAEQSLRDLLGLYRGRVAVGERGDLLFEFDRGLIRHDHEPWWTRFKRGVKRFLSGAFKAWIVVMLTVYFVLFVALLLAAIFGGRAGGRGSRRVRIPNFWIWYMFWTRDWRWGRPYYGHRWEKRRGARVPFYKKVFAFVFGPDRQVVTREDRDRETLALVRARRGVLAPAELVEYTGLPITRASEELARLMSLYGGDVRVSDRGEIAYVFPELMVSAGGRVRASTPEPAWRRLEYPRSLTGNPASTDRIIGAMNGFNLVASAVAPWTLLGPSAPIAVYVGLFAVPFTFSTLFFAVPLARRWQLTRENHARRRSNIRKALLSIVFQGAVEGNAVSLRGATVWVQHALEDDRIEEAEVQPVLEALVIEFDADVEADDSGRVRYRFPRVREHLAGAEEVRTSLSLDRQRIGTIVYASDDTPDQATRRDLAAFDAELRRTLPTPGHAAYQEEGE